MDKVKVVDLWESGGSWELLTDELKLKLELFKLKDVPVLNIQFYFEAEWSPWERFCSLSPTTP